MRQVVVGADVGLPIREARALTSRSLVSVWTRFAASLRDRSRRPVVRRRCFFYSCFGYPTDWAAMIR
jgi:hypothetical protein